MTVLLDSTGTLESMSEDRTGDELQRVTVKQAAELLGVQEASIRKRMQRGTLDFDKDPDTGRVHVYISEDEEQARWHHADDERTYGDESYGHTHDSTQYVSSLEEQIQFLREQLREEREANRENRRIIALQAQRLPELQERRESSTARTEGETPSPDQGEPHSAAQRPQSRLGRWVSNVFGR